jgi:hypothetical protein
MTFTAPTTARWRSWWGDAHSIGLLTRPLPGKGQGGLPPALPGREVSRSAFAAAPLNGACRAISPISIESVKTGMCRPCCSSAATGKTTGVSLPRAAMSGQVRSARSMGDERFGRCNERLNARNSLRVPRWQQSPAPIFMRNDAAQESGAIVRGERGKSRHFAALRNGSTSIENQRFKMGNDALNAWHLFSLFFLASFFPWTRKAVAELLERQFGLKLLVRTMGLYRPMCQRPF